MRDLSMIYRLTRPKLRISKTMLEWPKKRVTIKAMSPWQNSLKYSAHRLGLSLPEKTLLSLRYSVAKVLSISQRIKVKTRLTQIFCFVMAFYFAQVLQDRKQKYFTVFSRRVVQLLTGLSQLVIRISGQFLNSFVFFLQFISSDSLKN